MSETLAKALLTGVGLPHSSHDPKMIETHISWLVLVGEFVYKLKKSIKLSFLDFSTIDKRKFYCEQEVRLNRRTAPHIYLDVMPVSGSEAKPRLGDDSQPFEYVVRMKRFEERDILDNLAAEKKLDAKVISALAGEIASFHQRLERDPKAGIYGSIERIKAPIEENFRAFDNIVCTKDIHLVLSRLCDWVSTQQRSLSATLTERHSQGFIRECHGDLHLANIFYSDSKCVLFDCIEFDSNLRWIDTASDLAFILMDLDCHHLHELSQQLLNEYLELTGDYGLLKVLPYYMVYRAMVRAKVMDLSSKQEKPGVDVFLRQRNEYLRLALQYTKCPAQGLLLMCGLSGTGKTTVARRLSGEISSIHVRSDVERKRLFGLNPLASSQACGLDIYTKEANQTTYDWLRHLGKTIVEAGYGVIIDATFINAELRNSFESLADGLNIPWCIVYCETCAGTAKQRLNQRYGDASEAGFEQYEAQCRAFDEFDELEKCHVVRIDTRSPDSMKSIVTRVKRLLKTVGTRTIDRNQ